MEAAALTLPRRKHAQKYPQHRPLSTPYVGEQWPDQRQPSGWRFFYLATVA
jgi:hypothetical protein